MATNGEILNIYEFYSHNKAKELLEKWYGKELEWLNRPWENHGYLSAKENYQSIYSVPFDGRIRDVAK